MLETEYVGDKFEVLVTGLAVYFTNYFDSRLLNKVADNGLEMHRP